MSMGDHDFEPVDDNGLTVEQSNAWRAVYIAIADLIQTAVATSPTPTEAHRRIGLLMLELRVNASAVDTLADTWNTADTVTRTCPFPAPPDPTPPHLQTKG